MATVSFQPRGVNLCKVIVQFLEINKLSMFVECLKQWTDRGVLHTIMIFGNRESELQRKLHFTNILELADSDNKVSTFLEWRGKINYTIDMVTTFQSIWSMAIHSPINDKSTHFWEHTSGSKLQWQLHIFQGQLINSSENASMSQLQTITLKYPRFYSQGQPLMSL